MVGLIAYDWTSMADSRAQMSEGQKIQICGEKIDFKESAVSIEKV